MQCNVIQHVAALANQILYVQKMISVAEIWCYFLTSKPYFLPHSRLNER